MDFLTGVFFVVGLRRSQGLVGTGGVRSDGRKSHDRAGSFTGSQGAQRPGTAWQTGDLSRKAPWSGCTRVRLTAALSLLAFCVVIGCLDLWLGGAYGSVRRALAGFRGF